jgi:ribosomal protein S19E (S16A)
MSTPTVFDVLSGVVSYHYADQKEVDIVTFLSGKLNVSSVTADVLVSSLKSIGFVEQGGHQTWITEKGRNKLEQLRAELRENK